MAELSSKKLAEAQGGGRGSAWVRRCHDNQLREEKGSTVMLRYAAEPVVLSTTQHFE